MKCTLPDDQFIVENSNGEVLLKASLLELQYIIGSVAVGQEVTLKERCKLISNALYEEFSTILTWGQVAHILTKVGEEIESLKKNTTSSQESLLGTE